MTKNAFAGPLLAVLLLSSIIPESPALHGQITYPGDGFVFGDEEVPRIDIIIGEAALNDLYNNPYSDNEYLAQFSFTRNGTLEEVEDVGIRFRGNTSRDKQKKSFRISFNTFAQGRDFHGLEKMNLNAETNDVSLVRSKLCWELFRLLGVPGSRCNHVLLYINGEFYGVYVDTEHIDEKFVRSRFGTNDGNLYKCRWPAGLTWLGADQDAYKFVQGDRRAYELRINEEWDDYADLARLIEVIDGGGGDLEPGELERVFNVQQYLKVMAVDVMTGNWDGYIGNRNNYYLYRDPATGRFEYIPYDLDNTFGIDWLGVDWSDRSIYHWNRDEVPLYEKVLGVEAYKEQYTAYIKKLAAYMASGQFSQEVERWHDRISSLVSQDPYYPLDWDYTYADFTGSLSTGWGGHVQYGVLEYASLRAASAMQETIQADAPPLISFARMLPAPGRVDVDWVAEDDMPGFTTALHCRIDGGDWDTKTYDNPSETDPVSGLQVYRDSLLALEEQAVVDIYFTVLDGGGQETRYPDTYFTVSFPVADGPLRINEFMASNSSTRADEYGEYDDWLEIYNSSGIPVWLGDVYLSDRMGQPGKYRFPQEYIYPGGFYLLWVDGQPFQGPRHTPFRMDVDGEALRLSGRPAEGFPVMDSLTFGPQATDVALGRSVDGDGQWIAFAAPTPGYSNLSTGGEEYAAEGLILYPNPVTGGMFRFNRAVSGMVINSLGVQVMQLDRVSSASTASLAPGVYLFRSEEGASIRFVVVR
jgi:spore coat protein H